VKEDALQKQIVQWCDISLHKDILYWSTPNERDPRKNMAGLIAMGLLGGVSDLIFVNSKPSLEIIFVELKRPTTYKKGKRKDLIVDKQGGELSDNQIAFQKRVEILGLPYYVFDNLDDFIVMCKAHGLTKVK
jgi:hypothetical protein